MTDRPAEPMGAPAVTVVIATRDRPQLLERALRSIHAQDYPGLIECLVVFDQSEPHDITFAPTPTRTLVITTNQRSQGLAGSRNTGIDQSTGAFVAFCDDDDEWLPTKLNRQVDALVEYPEVDIAVTGISVHYGDRVVPRVPSHPRIVHRDLLRSRVSAGHPSSVVVRATAVRDGLGYVDEEVPGSYGEDYEWLLRMTRRTPVIAIQEPLVNVYWHPASYFDSRWRTIIEGLEYILDRYPEFADEPKGRARIEGQIAFAAAALGDKELARGWRRRARSDSRLEPRTYLSWAVGSGLVRADSVVKLAHHWGRGI